MSDFGLSIAASGLNADTAELDTASNNLSNINTPGYAQEVVNLSPEAAAGPLQAGRGVTVASVSELTDAVYESANVAAEGVQGAANQTNQVMTSIEAVFPEPSSDGLSGLKLTHIRPAHNSSLTCCSPCSALSNPCASASSHIGVA